ncbi:MAG TPA: hypothetical protein VMU92_00705 [Acidobacteriaceae bacterium]|nr:hypothetical protein [Acidobacteriaceae bacterium]
MKLLSLYVAAVLVAGVAAVPHVARAQALGEAATLSAGVSSAGSGAGSTLGRRVGGAMRSEGRRMGSSGRTSTSGGVMNLHWSRAQRERYERTERARRAHSKTKAKTKNGKPQPAFVIFGADTPDAGSGDAAVSQPKPDTKKDASGSGGKK